MAVFGILIFTVEGSPPSSVRPLMAYGATVFLLTISLQLTGNQFGYDRSGFRAFVLSPIPRREILLGKNLAVAPLIGGPEVAVAAHAPGGFKPARFAAALMVTYGWFAACYHHVWQIALFVTLKQSFQAYAGAMALAALAGAACGLILPAFDFLDRDKNFTLAYVCVAEKK